MRKPRSPKKKWSKGKKRCSLAEISLENYVPLTKLDFQVEKRTVHRPRLEPKPGMQPFAVWQRRHRLTYRHDPHLPRCHPVFLTLTAPGARPPKRALYVVSTKVGVG